MNDDQFRQLLGYFDFSWAGYRKVRKGVKKRIGRHMMALGCEDLASYLSVLESDDASRLECDRLMTVSISRFFRDRRLWEGLREEILPPLVRGRGEPFRVWSAGCAGGEEAYSFHMMWALLKESLSSMPEVVIIATDLNEECLERARAGVYTPGSLREVSKGLRKRFFETLVKGQRYGVKPFLKENICWERHQLLGAPPGDGFHIILLRNNVMTYFQEPLRVEVLNQVISSLAPSGLLVLGARERLPESVHGMVALPDYPFIYRKEPG
ncbi:chemotaxis protein CheR [Desulfoluna limicola]|uniref:Chemotaxis protein CheR n=1 Tax=Desulfoluna limicola TaxID=2810562 RepID=A0ABM7PH25_9BACT|nr:protein-glutamate O-methyltransferase CheR [Desulfoluna limicola]BCS96373.1 chemotaxis protein CheR [Desulfoluna limicola]